MLRLYAFFLILAVFLAACGDNTSTNNNGGNPSQPDSLVFSADSVSLRPGGDTEYVWQSDTIAVDSLEFRVTFSSIQANHTDSTSGFFSVWWVVGATSIQLDNYFANVFYQLNNFDRVYTVYGPSSRISTHFRRNPFDHPDMWLKVTNLNIYVKK